MKKCFFFTIILTLVISFTTIAGATENDYSLQGETFTVYTADGLMEVAAKINADTAYAGYDINIANDLDMTGKKWVPIGKDAQHAYRGTINGGGHTVKNLTATNYSEQNLAFVGIAADGAQIKSLHLQNVDFHSTKRCVSGIIADVTARATISDCTVEGKISSEDNYAGGLVAVVSTAESDITIENCAVNAMIQAAGHSAAGIVAGDTAGGHVESDLETFPIITARKTFVTGDYIATNRVASFMGYNTCANVTLTDCVSLATLKYTKTSENGAFLAVDNKSKIYLENCIAFSNLHAFYNLSMTDAVQTVEFKNCYLLQEKSGKKATIATYNRNGYYKHDASATYKYIVIADVIVDGVGPEFTPFTESNTTYRVPIIQYNLPSGTEEEVLSRAGEKATAMFENGSIQQSFVHKHAWAEGSQELAPTYMATGITAHKCTTCHAIKRVDTPCKESTIKWDYDEETKTLTISGEGSMIKVFNSNNMPWKSVRDEAEKLIVEEGIIDVCDYAFSRFTALKNVVLPETLTTIYKHAFEYCSSLESINIPESVKSIGYGVFRYAKNATPQITSASEEYTVNGNCLIEKATLTVIAGFKNSTIPTDATIATTIRKHAFQGCTGLAEMTIPANITVVEEHAFADCYDLKTADLSENVTEISEGLFSGCYSLENIVLPTNVTTIGALAFNECTGLTEITLPETITTIGVSAFDYCLSLEKATYTGSSTKWKKVTVEKGNAIIEKKIKYSN